MALALAEAGATVYCLDLADIPSSDFKAAVAYAKTLGSDIKYIKANVCDQKLMNELMFNIAEEEGHIDVSRQCCFVQSRDTHPLPATGLHRGRRNPYWSRLPRHPH
mgnify:FL=1